MKVNFEGKIIEMPHNMEMDKKGFMKPVPIIPNDGGLYEILEVFGSEIPLMIKYRD
jgi:hypothetical protein